MGNMETPTGTEEPNSALVENAGVRFVPPDPSTEKEIQALSEKYDEKKTLKPLKRRLQSKCNEIIALLKNALPKNTQTTNMLTELTEQFSEHTQTTIALANMHSENFIDNSKFNNSLMKKIQESGIMQNANNSAELEKQIDTILTSPEDTNNENMGNNQRNPTSIRDIFAKLLKKFTN